MQDKFLSKASSYFPFIASFLAVSLAYFWAHLYSDAAALRNDAGVYFNDAIGIFNGTRDRLLSTSTGTTYSDIGYANALAAWFHLFPATVKSAQLMNAVLWGATTFVFYHVARDTLSDQRAFVLSILAACSPTLTSFSGKIYSEHLAIFWGILCLFGFSRGRGIYLFYAFIGGIFLVLTKSAFYFFFIVFLPLAIIKKWMRAALVALIISICAFPIQTRLQGSTRGRIQVAIQTSKIELLSYSLIMQCSAYNLSLSLGQKLFPNAEGACRLNATGMDLPNGNLNPEPAGNQKVQQGFTYRDGIKAIFESPVKYALIGVTGLFAALWIEGIYPEPIQDFSPPVRTVLWLLKVLYSSALWLGAVLFFITCRRNSSDQAFARTLLLPVTFIFLFQMNVPPEQRYFFPLIPLLYLAAGSFYFRTKNKSYL